MKFKNILPLLLVVALTACREDTPDEVRTNAINDRTVRFLDKADTELKPCMDAITNKNSSDIAIVVTCQNAVFLYRKYGGHDYLAPLYLTLIKEKDIIRAKQLVTDLDMIESLYTKVEERNKDNMYFQQISDTQRFAQSAADFGRSQVGEDVSPSDSESK